MVQQGDTTPSQLIEDFWAWFAQNSSQIIDLYSRNDVMDLSDLINHQINKIDKQLAWEIGPGIHKPYLFTISSEGNFSLRPVAEKMIGAAPALIEWEFYYSRPSREPAARVRLPGRNLQFDTSGWKFVPLEHPDRGKLDLLIMDEQLARSEPEASLTAVSIYLDQLLGEDTVETWIGKFNIDNPSESHHEKLYDMAELSDYLYWAIHRETNPLKNQ
jgi:hypothetical protein